MTFKSQALVDMSGFGKTLNDIQGGFSALEFFDFCTAVEGIVLFDELLPVGDMDKCPENWKQHFDYLAENGVIGHPITNSKIAKLNEDINLRGGYISISGNKTSRSTLQDAYFESSRLIGAEDSSGIPALSLVRHRPIYERHAKLKEMHTVCCLVSQYSSLDKALQQIRNVSRLEFAPYVTLPIPAIPLMVVSRSMNKEQLLIRSLELREEYSGLRASLTELRAMFANPDISPKEKQNYKTSWMKTWATLDKYKTSGLTLKLADASKDKISVERSLDGIGLDSFQLSKILEKLIERGVEVFHTQRIRALHSTARSYMDTTDGQINREIRRLYGHEVCRQDVEWIESYSIGAKAR